MDRTTCFVGLMESSKDESCPTLAVAEIRATRPPVLPVVCAASSFHCFYPHTFLSRNGGREERRRIWILVIPSNLGLKVQFMETGRGGQFKLGQEYKQKNVSSGAKLATTHTLLILHSLRKKSECKRVSYQKLRLTTLILVVQFLHSVWPFQKMACGFETEKKVFCKENVPVHPPVLNTALLQHFTLAEHLHRSVHAQGKATSTHQYKMTRQGLELGTYF